MCLSGGGNHEESPIDDLVARAVIRERFEVSLGPVVERVDHYLGHSRDLPRSCYRCMLRSVEAGRSAKAYAAGVLWTSARSLGGTAYARTSGRAADRSAPVLGGRRRTADRRSAGRVRLPDRRSPSR